MREGQRSRGLTHVRGQGQQLRVPGCDGAGTQRGATARRRSGRAAQRRYPASEVRGSDERSYPASKVRGGGQEDQPHVQGAVAAWAQEGLEELSHVEGQEGRQ